MGRKTPSQGLPPASQRKEARAKHARTTINKTIPALLASNARARRGVEASELIVDPPSISPVEHPPTPTLKHSPTQPFATTAQATPPFTLRLVVSDTLTAASHLTTTSKSKKNIAVLNMASPLRPGGGVLSGATSQEESLCLRTTLYPALREEFYRLPELGVVYTPDVCVFQDSGGPELARRERWYVDVVSAGMLRFPDVDEGEDDGGRYASEKDRRMVEDKMGAVLRVLCGKGVEQVVLGAWGCGAYGNPVGEVARAWRRVLLGEGELGRQKGNVGGKGGGLLVERWESLREVVFAIKERRMAEMFAKWFGDDDLQIEEEPKRAGTAEEEETSSSVRELEEKIMELEIQISQVQNPDLKARLEVVLMGLREQSHDKEDDDSADETTIDIGEDSEEDIHERDDSVTEEQKVHIRKRKNANSDITPSIVKSVPKEKGARMNKHGDKTQEKEEQFDDDFFQR